MIIYWFFIIKNHDSLLILKLLIYQIDKLLIISINLITYIIILTIFD